MITLESSVFDDRQRIPTKYTGEGDNVSPPLRWNGVPDGAVQLALICDDPDAPREEPFVHWVLYGIPPETDRLEEGSADGAIEGRNDFGDRGWGGPMPPEGHGTHHYRFRIYALDTDLQIPEPVTKQQLVEAMGSHVLDEGELVGTYSRG